MTYLLDTNAVSDLMKPENKVETWIARLDRADRLVTCTIVRGEILFGIAKLPHGKRRAELEATSRLLLPSLRCEPIPPKAADFYADLKLARQQRGLALDENDLWIAATALALGGTLVTRDRDFLGIDGLPVVSLE